MVYKVWQVTYVTKKLDGDITHFIKEKVKKENHKAPYLFETNDLSELRDKLKKEKGCNRVEFSYDSEL